ncbi:MAG: GLPGLI family protein [Muribaculaceae bacterium]|nr:GLPGLI family protein [Muribaculaceae bacterium]
MKSFLLTLLVFLAIPIKTYAQYFILPEEDSESCRGKSKVAKTVVIDTAKHEIIYLHSYKDKNIEQIKTDYEMLTLGNKFRWYGGYANYQLDSIQRKDPELIIQMSGNEYAKFRSKYKTINDELTIHIEDSVINYYGKVFINYFKYQEPLPKFKWNLEDESMEIMGYECYKATTRWRGRDWTAWYCDIPVSGGPWKFNGLPGLILRLEDAERTHVFEAIQTKNDIYNFGYKKRSHSKTTRVKYNEALKDYKENSRKILQNSGMVKYTTEEIEKYNHSKFFFAPIELE